MVAEPVGRKAPYAPIVALREFFERMRDMSPPARIDRRFIQKMNVASNNEWALLSALKFLGVVDERGVPTHAYRLLQTTDRFQDTLAHLVRQSYADLFASGIHRRGTDELRDYFRLTSSPSQARNATRFFREVCALAGMEGDQIEGADRSDRPSGRRAEPESGTLDRVGENAPASNEWKSVDELVAAKIRLIDKLPAARDEWGAGDYAEICRHFAHMIQELNHPA
ncbi:MAG TPA: DUF5343 domain-containing protein [Chloroflexota bacterium]